jgi:hypothetical protein
VLRKGFKGESSSGHRAMAKRRNWRKEAVSAMLLSDAVSFRQLNANTYHVENKLKGKVVSINHIVVAADGKSRTSTMTGTNAEGKKINNVVVDDRQ